MRFSEFSHSKVEEDPCGFIDEVYKSFYYRMTSTMKVELAAYQLKDLAQVWF